jgi:hypothetical protein
MLGRKERKHSMVRRPVMIDSEDLMELNGFSHSLICVHSVDFCAIVTLNPETDGLSRFQVVAVFTDDGVVNQGELVG